MISRLMIFVVLVIIAFILGDIASTLVVIAV